MDSVAYMTENPDFLDEPYNDQISSNIQIHDSLIHIYSKDWPENYDLVDRFHALIESYSSKDGVPRHVNYFGLTCTLI